MKIGVAVVTRIISIIGTLACTPLILSTIGETNYGYLALYLTLCGVGPVFAAYVPTIFVGEEEIQPAVMEKTAWSLLLAGISCIILVVLCLLRVGINDGVRLVLTGLTTSVVIGGSLSIKTIMLYNKKFRSAYLGEIAGVLGRVLSVISVTYFGLRNGSAIEFISIYSLWYCVEYIVSLLVLEQSIGERFTGYLIHASARRCRDMIGIFVSKSGMNSKVGVQATIFFMVEYCVNNVDRVLVERFSGLEMLGLFVIAQSVASLVYVPITPINSHAIAYLGGSHREYLKEKKRVQISIVLTGLTSVMASLTLLRPLLGIWLGSTLAYEKLQIVESLSILMIFAYTVNGSAGPSLNRLLLQRRAVSLSLLSFLSGLGLLVGFMIGISAGLSVVVCLGIGLGIQYVGKLIMAEWSTTLGTTMAR